MPVPKLGILIIDGIVTIDETQDFSLSAADIFVRLGTFSIGTADKPYEKTATFTLTGGIQDPGVTVDSNLVVQNGIVNTGKINFYGAAPNTTSTRLTATAFRGAKSITVLKANGWKVGDKITLSPTFSNFSETETVTITSISDTTVGITPLLYTHYGAPK